MIWDTLPKDHRVVLVAPAPFLIQGNAIRVTHPSGEQIQGKITEGCPFHTPELSNNHLQAELIRWHDAASWQEIASLYRQPRKLVLLLLKVA